MNYLPHERLKVEPLQNYETLVVTLPWLSMEVDILPSEKSWVIEAVENLHLSSLNQNTQKFLKTLKDYPLFYYQPRKLEEFQEIELQKTPEIGIDPSTPQKLVSSFNLSLDPLLQEDMLPQWTWNWQKILEKALIQGTDLYDPLSFVSYLICYRLEWESTTWSGQDGLGELLEQLLQKNEIKFFQAIGWISKQSHYVTMNCCEGMRPALESFATAQAHIEHFIKDEAGHYKFMDQVFEDLGLSQEEFTVWPATKWMLLAHHLMASLSPLAFSAMINLFEAAYYEGQDPLSRVLKKSSKPHAARGYDLHYKINQEHRHCDMPLTLAQKLAPQPKEHLLLTLEVFELTLHFLDQAEKRLDQFIKI